MKCTERSNDFEYISSSHENENRPRIKKLFIRYPTRMRLANVYTELG
jgi:hypothetical protein